MSAPTCKVFTCDSSPITDGYCIRHRPKPAPSAEPDPELEFWLDPLCTKKAVIRLSALRMLMAPIGLAIVPAADVPPPEERKVLEALEEIQTTDLMNLRLLGRHRFVDAMLARRLAKEADPAERSRRETGDW